MQLPLLSSPRIIHYAANIPSLLSLARPGALNAAFSRPPESQYVLF